MMMLTSEHTPSEVLFDTLKKRGGIAHKELAQLILSNRPLGDGRSPIEHAKDRTWLSHVIVHAPAGAQQERYFGDFGLAAVRVMNLLRSRKGRGMSSQDIIGMLGGETSKRMQRALEVCHQDPNLYRNAFVRLVEQDELSLDERAEDCLVLFIAAGCSANARLAAAYALEYARSHNDEPVSTPQAQVLDGVRGRHGENDGSRTLGVVRVVDGYVAGNVHWVRDDEQGMTIGAFATGPDDVTEVGDGVSGRHVRIRRVKDGTWTVEDLGSTNGTELRDGATGRSVSLKPHAPYPIHAGDELRLAEHTVFSVIQGWA